MSSSSRRFVNASATGPTMVSGILSVCPRRSPYAGVGRRGAVVVIPSRTTTTGIVEYRGASGSIPAYLARPSGDGVWPGVVVIHDLFGLMDHTRDIAERLAYEGYVALAPNLFASPELAAVLTPANVQKAMAFMFPLPRPDPVVAQQELAKLPPDQPAIIAPTVERLLGGLPRERFAADPVAAGEHLKTVPFVKADRIGCVGFCFGGGLSPRLPCHVGGPASRGLFGRKPVPHGPAA